VEKGLSQEFWKILPQSLEAEVPEGDIEVLTLLSLDEIEDKLWDFWPWDEDAAWW